MDLEAHYFFPEVVEIRKVLCTMALHHGENWRFRIKNEVDFKLSLNQAYIDHISRRLLVYFLLR